MAGCCCLASPHVIRWDIATTQASEFASRVSPTRNQPPRVQSSPAYPTSLVVDQLVYVPGEAFVVWYDAVVRNDAASQRYVE